MRQTLVLNLVVLGFFVVLFRSIYRKRPSSRLQMWIAAFLCAMVHFGVGLWQPTSPVLIDIGQGLFLGALMLCGLFLLFSHPAFHRPGLRGRFAWPAVAAIVCISVACCWPAAPSWFQVSASLLFQFVALWVLWTVSQGCISGTLMASVPVALFFVWSLHLIYHGPQGQLDDSTLTELFFTCTALFVHAYRRASAGAWTMIFGMAAWACVWVGGIAVEKYAPGSVIDPEVWNVPKVVVAFGMLVYLFEDEVALALRDREQYRHLFETNPTPMWLFDKDSLRLLEANSAAVRIFGWRQAELPGLTVNDLVFAPERSQERLPILNRKLDAETRRDFPATALTGEVHAATLRFQTRRGEELMVEATVQRARFQDRQARLLMAKDITAQTRAYEQLVHMANHDPLTGLPNRLLLRDRLETAIAAVNRRGGMLGILCVDLDRFKQINDTYGHAVGDSCLGEVASRLRARLRAMDTAARIGGEEFMVVLSDLQACEDAEAVAEDLLIALSRPHSVGGLSISMSASIGIAIYPAHSSDISSLWSQADAAMYSSKQNGGNRCTVYSLTRQSGIA